MMQPLACKVSRISDERKNLRAANSLTFLIDQMLVAWTGKQLLTHHSFRKLWSSKMHWRRKFWSLRYLSSMSTSFIVLLTNDITHIFFCWCWIMPYMSIMASNHHCCWQRNDIFIYYFWIYETCVWFKVLMFNLWWSKKLNNIELMLWLLLFLVEEVICYI